ncbi:hypothetical protein V1506DRAFT_254493 [Lipomyces tetrasporus]
MPSPAISSIGHMPAPSFSPELAPFQSLSPPDNSQLSSSASVTNGGGSVSSPTNNSSFPLRVKNLPRDLSRREFNLVFTFAKDYIASELVQVPQDDYVGGSSLSGIAYFKSYSAAVEAHDVLDSRSDLFYDPPNTGSSPVSGPLSNGASSTGTTTATSSPTYYPPIKCEFPELKPQPTLSTSFDHHHMPHHSSVSGTPSHTAYSQLPATSSASASVAPFAPSVSSFPGLSSLSSLSGPGGPSAAAGKSSSRFNFPFESLSPTSPAAVPPVQEPEFYQDLNMFSPSSTSPRGTFSSGPGELQRVSGKSMLLESAGRDNEEYEDMVKDPLSWMRANGASSSPQVPGQPPQGPPPVPQQQQWQQPDRARRNTATSVAIPTRAFSNLSLNPSQPPPFPATGAAPATPSSALAPAGQPATSTAPQPPTPQGAGPAPSTSSLHALQNGGRVLPPANPADQNPPCNTLYVGNLPMNTSEDELKALFSRQRGYKRLCFRTKMNGPMCFVEFEDVAYATRALTELYGRGLSNSVKGGIRLSFSKNPLGVRSNSNNSGSSGNTGGTNQSNGASAQNGNIYPQHHHQHSQVPAQPPAGAPGQLGGIASLPIPPIMPPQGVHQSQQVQQQQASAKIHPSVPPQTSPLQQQQPQQQVQQPQPINLGGGMGIGMGIGTGV